MIDILLVDDHELVRHALCRLLNEAKGIKVIGQAASGEEAILLLGQIKPDVIIMDVNMPGIGGLEATRKILRISPKAKILIISANNEEPLPSHLLQAGALGYLTKESSLEEMIQAVRLVYSGRRYLGGAIAQQIALQRYADKKTNPLDGLSQRELQILLMIVHGMKPHEIGEKLNISAKTVNSYRYRLFDKLDITSDVELTLLAIKNNIIDLSDKK